MAGAGPHGLLWYAHRTRCVTHGERVHPGAQAAPVQARASAPPLVAHRTSRHGAVTTLTMGMARSSGSVQAPWTRAPAGGTMSVPSRSHEEAPTTWIVGSARKTRSVAIAALLAPPSARCPHPGEPGARSLHACWWPSASCIAWCISASLRLRCGARERSSCAAPSLPAVL